MLNPKAKLYRWGPISACPLFMYFTIETAFVPLKKLFGITYTESLIIFKDKKVTWLLDAQELGKQSQQFVDKVILNRKNRQEYFQLWTQRTERLSQLFSHLDRLNFESLANGNLTKEYAAFAELYSDWFTVTISLELAASSLEPLLGQKIKQYYTDSPPKAFHAAFSTLSAPLTLTFYRQEQKELLEILRLFPTKRSATIKKHQM